MPRQKQQFPLRFYAKSEHEEITIRTRARMLNKSLSTYLRDLVIQDLYQANMRSVMDTSEIEKLVRKFVKEGNNDAAADLLHPAAGIHQGIHHHEKQLTPEQIAASSARLNEQTPEEKAAAHDRLLRDLAGDEAEAPSSPPDNLPNALKPDNFKPISPEEMELEISEELEK